MQRRPRFLSAALALLLAGLAACGFGEAVVERVGGVDTDTLVPGDCFDAPQGGLGEVSTVRALPCDEPHTGEVIDVFSLRTNGGFPGDREVVEMASFRCGVESEMYTGRPYESDNLAVRVIRPTAESWNQGDRLVTCYLADADDAPLTGSVASDDHRRVRLEDMEIGDCFDWDDLQSVRTLIGVDCSQPHLGEVVYSESLPDGPVPPLNAIDALYRSECESAFDSNYGQDEDSYLEAIQPNESTWLGGDRLLFCFRSAWAGEYLPPGS